MGSNPYKHNDETVEVFVEEEGKKSLPVKRIVKESKNPYLNGRYALNEEKVDVEGNKKGKNPYLDSGDEVKEKNSVKQRQNPYKTSQTAELKKTTPKKMKKKNNVALCVGLSVIFFFVGGLTTWFALGENTRSFLKVKFLINNLYYKDIDEDDFYNVVFDSINNDLLDNYSAYLTEDEYQQFLKDNTGEYIGTGLAFPRYPKEGQELQIVYVAGNSPAEAQGIKVGSYIKGIGVRPETILPCSSFQQFSALMSEFGEYEVFYLSVLEGETLKTIEIWKESFIENYVFYRSDLSSYRFGGEKALTMMEGGAPLPELGRETAYIRLTQFNGNAGKQFAKAMETFKTEGKRDLVLDLRGNGGGSVEILCDIAQYFCKNTNAKKPVVLRAIYSGYEEVYKADGNRYNDYFNANSRIYVLADNGTASASEALMGCMLDYGTIEYKNICLSYRDDEVKTYGKGIMQMTLPLLFGQDAMTLTVAKLEWPKSGICIQDRGILPSDGTLTVAEGIIGDEEIRNALFKLFKGDGTLA